MSAFDLIGTFTAMIGSGLSRSPFGFAFLILFILIMFAGWLYSQYILYRKRLGGRDRE
jgi:hypothetical protein